MTMRPWRKPAAWSFATPRNFPQLLISFTQTGASHEHPLRHEQCARQCILFEPGRKPRDPRTAASQPKRDTEGARSGAESAAAYRRRLRRRNPWPEWTADGAAARDPCAVG